MSTLQTPNTPLVYQAIKRQLGREIGRRWTSGSRLPPINELAQMLGTGKRNTHRAVRELVDEGVLVSRPGMGTYVSAEIDVEQFRDIVRTAEDLQVGGDPAQPLAGCHICVITAEHSTDLMIQEMRAGLIAELKGKGAIITSHLSTVEQPLPGEEANAPDAFAFLNPEVVEPIEIKGDKPVVVISTSSYVTVAMPQGYDVVSVDQEQGGVLAGRRLRDAGCRGVCFIGASAARNQSHRMDWDNTSIARLRGFVMGWGSEVPLAHQLVTQFYCISEGARMVQHYMRLSPRPTGVFCASDELAVGFLIGAMAYGLRHGDDFRLVGFDGQGLGRMQPEGPLTTVRVPAMEMGRKGAELLAGRIEQPDQPVRRLFLGCSLFEGNTVTASNELTKSRAYNDQIRARLLEREL